MPVFRLPDQVAFPDPTLADRSGLLAVGGDLRPERVMLAYRMGIFPWFSEGEPVLWWSPDPRMVLRTADLHLGRSLRKRLRQGRYTVTMDQAFSEVIARCAAQPRQDQDGTWITQDMVTAYETLHAMGHAHSVETWLDGELVGGLYGIAAGRLFCGESMFAAATDASKVAFAVAVRQLTRWGVPLIDCQVHTDHLARFGAEEVSRRAFLGAASSLVAAPAMPSPWVLDADLAAHTGAAVEG